MTATFSIHSFTHVHFPSHAMTTASSILHYFTSQTKRHGTFLLGGLKIVEKELHEKNVSFQILTPANHADVGQHVHNCIEKDNASVVVCDMSPLRQYREWIEEQASPLFVGSKVPIYQVDAQ